MALARVALEVTSEVVFVLPRELPHKRYEGVSFEARIGMLLASTAGEPRFSVASSDGGLFAEIARECHIAYKLRAIPAIICGRDAAERIVSWDYGSPGAIERMLREFDLLVGSRGGAYRPPAHLRDHVHNLALPPELDAVSASDVRRRIAAREPWEHLVPEAAVPLVRRYYFNSANFL